MRIITRAEWGAPPIANPAPLKHPVQKSRIHHMAAAWHRAPSWTEKNFKRYQKRYLRSIDAYHRSKGWSGIGYNLIVFRTIFGRSVVYEGRGVRLVGAHSAGENSTSLGVCIVGDYTKQKPGRLLMWKIRRVFDHLVDTGVLTKPRKSHPTGGHRDAPGANTACPGDNLQKKLPAMRRRFPDG